RVIELQRLEPIGAGNSTVHLVARGLNHCRPPEPVGKEQQHLKLWVTDGSRTVGALWWNCSAKDVPEGPFDLAFAPQLNEYNGTRSVQLKVIDCRPSE